MNVDVLADDGCRLWTVWSGNGPPLVLCHGGPGLWDYFDDVADMLRDLVRTVRWDQRGCGRSEQRQPYTVARFVADLDAVRQHCGAERISLLGHSWGALLALRYTIEHPDRVSSLIYVSGTGIDPGHTWKTTFRRNIEQRIGTHAARWKELGNRDRTPDEDREHAILQWMADFVDPATARRHAERLGTPWLGINYECANSINVEVKQYLQDHDVPTLCRTLSVPTLIIDGDQDLRPRWAVDSLAEALPNVQRARWSPWRGNAVEPIIRDALAIAAGAGLLPWTDTWEVGGWWNRQANPEVDDLPAEAVDLIWGPDDIVQAWSA